MFIAVSSIFIGLILLLCGADFFVLGAVAIANRLKISTLIIGLTIVALGTSLPELTVSVKAAISGNSAISLGNVIGSNIANILLVLGLSALIYPINVNKNAFIRDFVFLFFTTLIFVCFCLTGTLSRWHGWVLLLILFWFMFYNYYMLRHDKDSIDLDVPDNLIGKNWLYILSATIVGLAGIIYGSDFLVKGAADLASLCGVSQEIIGVTIIAVGTSAPELATSCVAAYRHQNGIALGNVMGSNIWNIVLIMGITASILDVKISYQFFVFDIWIMLASTTLLLPLLLYKDKLRRCEGLFMFCCYIAYLYAQYLIIIKKVIL